MLERLYLQGFKAFDASVIPLRPFTVLIGPNGAGKTTILEAIEALGGLVTGTLEELLARKRWAYGDLAHRRAATREIGIWGDLRLGGAPVRWILRLGARRRPGVCEERVVSAEEPRARGGRRPRSRGTWDGIWMMRTGRRVRRWAADGKVESGSRTPESSCLTAIDEADGARFPELLQVARWARRIRGDLALDPRRLRSPSRGRGDGAGLGVRGEGLAAFLAGLEERDGEAFARVEQRVREHYPQLVRLHPVRGGGWTHLELTERWGRETARVGAAGIADGLLRLIAIAAMHELPIAPSVILLDEIENGLHPRLLGGIMKLLQDLVRAKRGETQIVLATHSPITVNFCESPGDVLLVTRGRDGHPTCTPLSKTRGSQKLRAHFDPGER